MDIKDWILIGGGALLVGVIAHGFWLAWRNRQDTLRMVLDPNPGEEVDQLILLRGELPNGGARLADDPEQGDLDLATEAPVLMEQAGPGRVAEPTVGPETFQLEPDDTQVSPLPADEVSGPVTEPTRERAHKVRAHKVRAHEVRAHEVRAHEAGRPAKAPARDEEVARPANELIVINVLARDGATFPGDKLMEVFLRNELRFGDMNIFHRIDLTNKAVQFSVASAVEPGTFDLSAMEDFSTLGITMFLRLPGPDEPLPAFDDMLCVARDVASSLGGDLKDEQLSVMTGQTSEHCRQRIAEFSRKRMSQRA